MNKKTTNEETFGIWKKNALAKIEAFHSYTDEDELRKGMIEIMSLVQDILDKRNEINSLLDKALKRESVLIEKYKEQTDATKSKSNPYDYGMLGDDIGMP